MKNKLIALPLIIISIIAASAISALSKGYDDEAKQRKLDYIYVEAARQAALDNSGTAFLLYDRVLQSDTNNDFAALYKGNYLVQSATTQDVFEKGLSLMKKYYTSHPEDKQASIYYGRILASQEYYDEALKVWANIDTLFPNDKEINYYYANTLLSTGDSANIHSALTIFEKLGPEFGQEWLTLNKLKAYLAMKDTTSAIAQTEAMIKQSEENAGTLITAGNVYQALNKPDSALTMYKRACETDSTNGYAFYSLASYYLSRGDSTAYDEAIFNALTKNSLEVDIKVEILKNYISNIYDIPEYQPKLKSLFDKLVDMHPHEGEIHYLYSQYLAYIQDYPKAAEQIGYAVDVDPANPHWTYLLIAYNIFGKDIQKAVEIGREAVKNMPEDADIAYMTSIAFAQDEQTDTAIVIARNAINTLTSAPKKDFNKISQIYTHIGDLYQQENENDSIRKFYDLALLYNPENLLALNNYAYALACYGNEEDLDKAEKMSAVTVQKEPENSTSLDTYAWIFFKKRNYKLAKEYIDKVLDLGPEPSAEIFHHAGDIYFMNGDPDKAVKFWEQALELSPDDELLKKKVTHKTYFYK